MNQLSTQEETAMVITPDQLLKHWQGHRALTRRVIDAFPEKELFEFSVGGMRPFAQLANEFLSIAVPGITEIVTGETQSFQERADLQGSKKRVLELWDEATEKLNALWAQIPAEKFQEKIVAFGMYEGTVCSTIFYFIDNEIHHRGQGYVYLRALGIEPPFFWER